MRVPPPIAMLAELTHRCPLSCPHCSNPVEMARQNEELETDTRNAVLDRRNPHQLPRALETDLEMGARRIEVATVQFRGWR